MDIAAYQQALVRVAFKITYDWENAKDVVQDAYMSILKKPDAFTGQSSFKTYLYRIVINKSLDMKRSQSRLFDLRASFAKETTNAPDHDTVPLTNESEITAALDKIPDKYRIPLLLLHGDGMSYQEIADVLNISLNVVRTRIFRCREKLRKELTKTGYRL